MGAFRGFCGGLVGSVDVLLSGRGNGRWRGFEGLCGEYLSL